MPTVADVVRRYGVAYLAKFGKAVPLEHRKVLSMIAKCRTGELGMVGYSCEYCQTTHQIGLSCGNRHCPSCQQHKTKAGATTGSYPATQPLPAFLVFPLPRGLSPWSDNWQLPSHPTASSISCFPASTGPGFQLRGADAFNLKVASKGFGMRVPNQALATAIDRTHDFGGRDAGLCGNQKLLAIAGDCLCSRIRTASASAATFKAGIHSSAVGNGEFGNTDNTQLS